MPQSRFEAFGKIDVNMLVALHIILSERSVGKAAADVGLSQPAMSNALARMRTAFGDPLLVRTHGKMELTVRGGEVLDQLGHILPQVERLARPPVFDPAVATASFNLASNDHAIQILGPEIVRIFSREAPDARLLITTVRGSELDDESQEGYDLRMGWFSSPPPTWFIRKLFEDEMVVIADPSCPFAGDTLSVELFTSLPHVALRMHPKPQPTSMDRMLQERDAARRIAVWLSNFSSIPPVISNSNLIALVPLTLAQRHEREGKVRIFKAPVDINTLRVSMAWSPVVHHDPANKWLRSVVARSAQAFAGVSGDSDDG